MSVSDWGDLCDSGGWPYRLDSEQVVSNGSVWLEEMN